VSCLIPPGYSESVSLWIRKKNAGEGVIKVCELNAGKGVIKVCELNAAVGITDLELKLGASNVDRLFSFIFTANVLIESNSIISCHRLTRDRFCEFDVAVFEIFNPAHAVEEFVKRQFATHECDWLMKTFFGAANNSKILKNSYQPLWLL
jgi:hypothetical protein